MILAMTDQVPKKLRMFVIESFFSVFIDCQKPIHLVRTAGTKTSWKESKDPPGPMESALALAMQPTI